MRRRSLIFMTLEELDQARLALTVEASKLPYDSPRRDKLMLKIEQLRTHASAKRWVNSLSLGPCRPGEDQRGEPSSKI
jgi:hypothetical protein